jgi:transcriptional regulator with XRE-family HTH domain
MEHKIIQIIENIRKEYGLSQRGLAVKIGISNSLMSQVENGVRAPSASLMKQILSIFPVDLETGIVLSDTKRLKITLNKMFSQFGPIIIQAYKDEEEKLISKSEKSMVMIEDLIDRIAIILNNNDSLKFDLYACLEEPLALSIFKTTIQDIVIKDYIYKDKAIVYKGFNGVDYASFFEAKEAGQINDLLPSRATQGRGAVVVLP